MVSKTVLFCIAQALFCQIAFAFPATNVKGNSVVENTVVIENSASNGYGMAGNGYGMAGNGYGMSSNGYGLASGLGVANNAMGVNLANNLAANSAFGGNGYVNLAALSAGGVLPVTSYGPIVPAGLTVVSDNTIEGVLVVNGEVPFLSAVAFEGALASGGMGAASCGCGDGSVGIVSENYGPTGLGIGNGLGVTRAGLGRIY